MLKTMFMAIALTVGLMAAAAPAATVTVDGKRWDITTVVGTFDALSVKLKAQPWWAGSTDDSAWSMALGGALGYPFGGRFAPFFADRIALDDSSSWDGYTFIKSDLTAATVNGSRTSSLTWAVATPAAIPLPAGGLLLLTGIAAAVAVGKRRRKAVA